ncbi:predicted protein, partial [Escherichia coli FVEC1412]
MPDATLARLIMPTGLNRRSDKALAPSSEHRAQ